MISGISGIGAPGVITNITSASLGSVSSVRRVVRGHPEAGRSAGTLTPPSEQPVDRFTPTGQENALSSPGTSYGLNANQLRSRGMASQMEAPAQGQKPGQAPEDAVSPDANPQNGDDEATGAAAEAAAEEKAARAQPGETKPNGEPLSDEEKKQLQELQARDAEVRTHEQAHIAASGGYAQGSPHYDYQEGPDGNSYAIGGSVKIDTSEESTPEATIAKMEKVRAAAMAPAEPSSQDRAVAAEASQKIEAARQELAAEKTAPAPEQSAQKAVEDDDAQAQAGGAMAASAAGEMGARAQTQGLPPVPDAEQARAAQNQRVAAASASAPTAKLSYQQQRAMAVYRAGVA